MKIQISANPNRRRNRDRAEQMILIIHIDGFHAMRVPVSDLIDASDRWARFRDMHFAGASDMRGKCGNVYNSSGVLIAVISYNGRINERG